MVAKKKTVARKGVMKSGITKAISSKGACKKLRIGVCIGKDFDPVKKGSEPPNFPKKLIRTKDDWGKYSVDAVTALRMKELHTDLLDIDIIPMEEMNETRLKKNHVNLTFWPEIGTAKMSEKKKHIADVTKCQKNLECRFDPQWDYYDWILCKPRYMQTLMKAGIPTIPTIIYKNGFNSKQCLKDVQKKGWDKFFVKVGHFAFFGVGAICGKTEDFLGKRGKDLEKYEKDNNRSNVFLLQPYTLKPNGEVFDEVRNFFIDGQWRYSVFTHGTDETDAGYYQEPDGPRKVACKAMAEKVYEQVLKTATWEGKKQTPLLNRIDIGVIPKKGADSLHKTDNTYFCNEIEFTCTTWLDRYAPINVGDVMAHASVKHALELCVGMLNNKKRRVPDAADVRKVCKQLNDRVGPLKNIKFK